MNPLHYQSEAMAKEANQKTIREYNEGLPDVKATRFTNGLIGLVDEVGELSELRKKWLEYRGEEPTKEQILEECGDVLWRTSQILTAFDLNLAQAMVANLKKLGNVRYKDTICNPEDAKEENRDREAEAREVSKVLEADRNYVDQDR